MSNIYIQEPPTSGKVLLKTSIGDLEIELWSREAPKASRNFVQLCLEGYYDGTIFHRVVKGFIAQGGDPLGDGTGGESVYGEPFKNEPHSRLRFCRRGLVALANSGNNDNGSQFFFTLGETPELQNKHTIFGKVVGDTIYNMIKFDELEIGGDDRPVFPPKINRTEVIVNPYSDIVPRQKKKKEKVKESKKKAVGVKNLSLLSFGDEAEEEEEDIVKVEKKSKSVHDVLDDPLMSSEPALRRAEGNKLVENVVPTVNEDSNDSLLEGDVPVKRPRLETEKPSTKSLVDIGKYQALKKNSSVKGKSRESFTLELLNKFKNKMRNCDESEKEDDWLRHEFKCVDKEVRLAKDANSKSNSWFDITDPRNELNVRKREDSSKALKKL